MLTVNENINKDHVIFLYQKYFIGFQMQASA